MRAKRSAHVCIESGVPIYGRICDGDEHSAFRAPPALAPLTELIGAQALVLGAALFILNPVRVARQPVTTLA